MGKQLGWISDAGRKELSGALKMGRAHQMGLLKARSTVCAGSSSKFQNEGRQMDGETEC